jgi:uncharacterized membrane protein YgdD (TMEM256/DUF423 family)
MHRVFFKIAAFFAALSVMVGAFGAHMLKDLLKPLELTGIQTAVTYQMTHSLAIFIVGMIYRHYATTKVIISGYFFIIGIILFSGSLYLRVILHYLGFEKSNFVVFFTPLGGASFILGWLTLMSAIPKNRENNNQTKE